MKAFALYTLSLGFGVAVVVSTALTNTQLTPTQAWEQSSNLKAEIRTLEANN